ncbi:hypothetical protein CJF42_06225 [Pseudoalteromonas sp. NBT06-2]|uniref:pre-peptidase C-terminal domain-containing protein n=1 Tax=Pseudoalteromonas sp. NBT06-2 TaxID=2025950 RepID=UPI000BA6DD36|nr:pre-peptidase C-terminal domain-containing protein [Pseudoalteromonas sp. NBT06-2]PAJ75243.1 hypothetical protein CJF42_06225 [Pseudoalteromonas sp. NBT06-2]
MNRRNTIKYFFKKIYLNISLSILACIFSSNVYANTDEINVIELSPLTKGDLVYTYDEMLNFDIKNYLNENAPHLSQYAEIISHHAGRTSISPQLIISLIEFKTQLISSFEPDIYIDKPFGLLSNKVGFSQQVEDITTKLNVLLFGSQASLNRHQEISDAHAKIAMQSLLSLSPESLGGQTIIEIKNLLFLTYDHLYSIMPDAPVSDSANGDASNLPPVDLLQFPFPVGESWHVGGTHSSESAIDYSNGGGWGSDVTHLWVSASAPGIVIVHSSCSVEVIHEGGWSTSYYHVDNIKNQNHERVERNQAIANYANNSAQALCQGGWSGGPHTHVTLKKNGSPFSLNGVTLSGYKIHAGNSDYDTNCNNYWLEKNSQKFCSAWFTNPGVGSVEPIEVVPLINNQILNNLTANKSESRLFTVTLPENASNLSVKLAGGSGDVDLYLRKAVQPTEKLYDCRSYNDKNAESCLIEMPISGTWYILMQAYKAYSGVSMQLSYIEKENEQVVVPLSKAQVISNLSASKYEAKNFKIEIPARATNFTVNTAGGTGDVDIYLAKNSIATNSVKTSYCSYGSGNQEQCFISMPSQGDWYILLSAYDHYENVTLQASYAPYNDTTTNVLSNNEIKSAISASTTERLYYTIDVPVDAKKLVINTFGGSGDADLYIKHANSPTSSNYICRSNSDGNTETCSVDNPSKGTWYIMLKAYSRFESLNLQGGYTLSTNNPGGSLIKNNISIPVGRWQYYAVNIPEGIRYLTILTSGGTGNADLYLRQGSKPTYTQNICRANTNNNTEECKITAPAAGVWYIGIFAYGGSALGVNLNAIWE